MRVLIKVIGKELYLARSKTWTTRITAARDFRSCCAALDYLHDHPTWNIELLYCFDQPDFNFVVEFAKFPKAKKTTASRKTRSKKTGKIFLARSK
jgi:hypothetical protein